MSFAVKDSGERMQFDSGMVRDVTEGKTDYSLVYDGPMLARWAEHLTKGAQKYEARNWMKASGQAELDRFRASAARHFAQWMRGDVDEDHAAAVIFNLNGAEYVSAQRNRKNPIPEVIPEAELHEIPHGEGFGYIRISPKMGRPLDPNDTYVNADR